MAENNARRPRRLISFEKFTHMVNNHVFVFIMLANADAKMLPQEFFDCVKKDRELLEIAWSGGDDYMQVMYDRYKTLLESVQKKVVYIIDDEQAAFENMLDCMSEERKKFFNLLSYFDWYWRYSDDIRVSQAGQKGEDAIKDYINNDRLFGESFYKVFSPSGK